MNPNLRWKAVFVFAVVFLCVYGLFGLPTFPTSAGSVAREFWVAHQAGAGPAGRHALDLAGAGE